MRYVLGVLVVMRTYEICTRSPCSHEDRGDMYEDSL
jgi:hypothetical protein